ncbi:MAG TPA: GNAT family N-acetyltransferase [Niallia sp.]|nr:GNAT family N-acetyltransferase [Niallia sp.]
MLIRTAKSYDAKSIAKVHVDSWLSTYKGIVPDAYLETLSYEEREELWNTVIPNGSVFVAEEENGKIIGFANGGKERSGDYPGYKGELYAIYILKEYQGKGIGTLLFHHVRQFLKDRNIDSMITFAFEDNTACQFYEASGGKIIGKEDTNIGGEKLKEVVYGWKNL